VNRVERIYKIHTLLKRDRPVPMRRIREELEAVSLATIKRDLAYMRDFMYAPIDYDRNHNGYRYDPAAPAFELPGLWFNHGELYALLACEQLLEAVQPGVLAPYIGPLRERLHRLLAASGYESTEIIDKVRLQPIAQRRSDPRRFGEVAGAVLAGRCLEIEYLGREHERLTRRTVHPARLLHYRGNWYLAAWCESAADDRLFALDRIRHATTLERKSRISDPESLDALLDAGFGIFGGQAKARAVLRFTAHRARWVADEIWHPEQTGVRHDDGTYELTVPYSDPRELLLDILRYGPDVEVLAPPELRAQVIRSLHEAAARYDKPVAPKKEPRLNQ